MLYVLIFAAFVALIAVAAFVWTVVRTAVEQITDNRRADAREAELSAHWTHTDDPDGPVTAWPTYTDPRARALRDEIHESRRAFDELDAELRRKSY
jgi:hypothetical protein